MLSVNKLCRDPSKQLPVLSIHYNAGSTTGRTPSDTIAACVQPGNASL